jgi:restriction system protein
MSRSFSSSMLRAMRAADRASRAAARQHAAQIRERERLQRRLDRQAKQDYAAARLAEAEEQNQALEHELDDLENLLSRGLARRPDVPLKSLYRQATPADLPNALQNLVAPNKALFLLPPPGFFASLWPGTKAKHRAAVASAEAKYTSALAEFQALAEKRQEAMRCLERDALAYNQQLDALQIGLKAGDPAAVKAYAELVIDHSPYPDNFEHDARVGFVKESNQLVIDLRVPVMSDIVPEYDHFRYVKAQDAIVGSKKSDKVRQAIYTDVVAQIALRTLFEQFNAGSGAHIQVIVLNIYVVTTDPGTGNVVRPYILSVGTTRDEFAVLNLAAVEPIACLKRLKAQVSRSAAELVPVKPIFDINMADPRFIEEQDVLSTLDRRPNLMELSPGEFESLITNLFQAMGLDTKLTQPSRDGGVDCVAFDPRPVLGGKVVVQAKRYKHTVGVSAVRDLFGTMHNEGASKGILVTTSGFGKAAFAFAEGKPMELLSGSNLLYLLREHAGVDAKIEPPEDWVDPVLDIGS